MESHDKWAREHWARAWSGVRAEERFGWRDGEPDSGHVATIYGLALDSWCARTRGDGMEPGTRWLSRGYRIQAHRDIASARVLP